METLDDIRPPKGPYGTCRGCGAEADLCAPEANPPEYHGLCATCAWRAWMKAADPDGFWNKVECIQCELGRTCTEHPEVSA
jgi:hypothetical protein